MVVVAMPLLLLMESSRLEVAARFTVPSFFAGTPQERKTIWPTFCDALYATLWAGQGPV